MGSYEYRAKDGSGRSVTGKIEASSEAGAAAELRTRGWLVLDVLAKESDEASYSSRRFLELSPGSIDVETGLRHIALMLKAGLSLLDTLATVETTARRKSMARTWREISLRIQAGSTFADALDKTRRFTPIVVELCRAGEVSGSLGEALERSSAHMERRRQIRGTFLQALFYPSIVVVLTFAVTSYMIVKVIPTLEGFLRGFHRPLPPITKALLKFSGFVSEHVPRILLAMVIVFGIVYLLDRLTSARRFFDRVLFAIPFIGTIRRMAITAMISRTLSILLSNGVDILASLLLVQGLMNRPLAQDAVGRARDGILRGRTLSEGLIGSVAISKLLPPMVAVGEKSGSLDKVLNDYAEFEEEALRTWIRRASALIEPVMTIVVGGVVGFVYIAFFISMFSVAGG